MADKDFQIKVVVLGVGTERESNYGPRFERETLATLDVPATADTAWQIFADALASATNNREPF